MLRAGIEEGKILLRRQDIKSLINDPDISPSEKEKFKLVLMARDYAEKINLKPKKSFTKYSKVNRDVLVWVLSASPKTSLEAYTWWFPIVGKVPYKGFFNKDDALVEFNKLKSKNYDVYLRPSAAFSTLGWFNDPLLSTTLAFDEVHLVNTVFHEIIHNTAWINNNVAFNESFAHVMASLITTTFFEKELKKANLAEESRSLLKSDLEFATFLKETKSRLSKVYKSEVTTENKLKQRSLILKTAALNWDKRNRYDKLVTNLNNAVIIAQSIYLESPELFLKLDQICEHSLECSIEKIKQLSGPDAFKNLENQLDEGISNK